ncbi:hypothetical protein AK812_SmicGene31249 [Symbiodinium microadriaticum]|uniref:Uncharacterized protein n=1 Tax=Symbiodinium microadriaticum TaxID=2951 RepID=A0A1Q9CXA5_SYMMI|nr:hypothetical protein AK812_SmicGene31249 [Symbiodinium microadriaticum]
MICHLCDAGAQGLPYTDVSSAPQWLSTLGASLPWESTPPLNEAPFSVSSPAFLYKLDPFHVLKFGIFRDACASTVIRLCFLEYFDCEGELQNVPERLSRAFSFYKLWCLAEKKNPSLKGFTRMNMHYDNNHSFAWFNCKGSEVTLLMQWLDFQLLHFLENVKQESHRPELRAMHQMIRGPRAFSDAQARNFFLLDVDSLGFDCVAGSPINRYAFSVAALPCALLWLITAAVLSRVLPFIPRHRRFEIPKTISTMGQVVQVSFTIVSKIALEPMMHAPRAAKKGQAGFLQCIRFLIARFRVDFWWYGSLECPTRLLFPPVLIFFLSFFVIV